MDHPLPIRVAQALGITLSSAWAGATVSFSAFLVPRLLDAPIPIMLRQWCDFYNVGKKVAPPISIIAGAAYFYIAYKLPTTSHGTTKADRDFWRYVAAGLLSACVAPYTILFMAKTNSKLLARAEEMGGLKATEEVVEAGLGSEGSRALVDHWGVLNMFRAGLLISSALIGTWTALN